MNSLAISKEQAITIKWHAAVRRLQAERASEEEVEWVLENHFDVVAEAMRSEFATALEMTPEARRIFMHPGREEKLGLVKPAVYFDRNGQRQESKSYRRNDGRYFWTGDVVMVLDGDVVVTCIIPDANQVETLCRVQPAAAVLDSRMRYIVQELRDAEGFIEPVSKVYAIAKPKEPFRVPRSVEFKREPPPTARWLKKPEAAWVVLVADDLDDSSQLSRRAVAKLRVESGPGYPTVFVERSDSKAAKAVFERLQKSHTVRARDLPEPPRVEWEKQADKLPNAARKWWSEMLQAGEAQGKILCVVTPETARTILETGFGSSDASWRKRLGACKPGTCFKIQDLFGNWVLEWSTF